MPKRIKYAAVGCGGMGRRHLRGAAELKKASFYNLELAAICDLKREQAELYAKEAEELLGRGARNRLAGARRERGSNQKEQNSG